jgi:hypothetical protein
MARGLRPFTTAARQRPLTDRRPALNLLAPRPSNNAHYMIKTTTTWLSSTALAVGLLASNAVCQSQPADESLPADPPSRVRTNPGEKSGEKDRKNFYRLLQSNDFLVDTPYLQDDDELQHTVTLTREGRRRWSSTFSEEIPLGSDKHQLTVTLPSRFFKTSSDRSVGIGDLQIQYNYGLLGSSASRFAVSPGVSITIPTGSARKATGSGAVSLGFGLPVGIMLSDRWGLNTSAELSFTKKARNREGERANISDFELGQSLVWFAKPKLNFLIEAVWERSKAVAGDNLTETENEAFVSPGVRWAHTFKNGTILSPGVAFPLGIGPSRGDNQIFFQLSFEHRIRKEQE